MEPASKQSEFKSKLFIFSGEKITAKEMDDILQFTETKNDNEGNIKYEGFPF